MEQEFFIKKLSFNVFDVFWGIGWEPNWTRFELKKQNNIKKLIFKKGKTMPSQVFFKIRQRIFNRKG